MEECKTNFYFQDSVDELIHKGEYLKYLCEQDTNHIKESWIERIYNDDLMHHELLYWSSSNIEGQDIQSMADKYIEVNGITREHLLYMIGKDTILTRPELRSHN
jgi:hypothetical protein